MKRSEVESITGWYDTSWEAEFPVFAEVHEAIARLAYSYWQDRGCPIGSPDEDWYRAENELRRPGLGTWLVARIPHG